MSEKNENDLKMEDVRMPEKEEGEKKKKGRSILREVLGWVRTIAIAVILAGLINFFLIANSSVPTGSMETTIPAGSRIIGWRPDYHFEDPQRGDIVIFKYPDDESMTFVKRIIGMPGETVTIIDGKVYINNSTTPLDEPYLTQTPTGSFGPYLVPADSYFMLGDNRDNSKDSRYWNNPYVSRDKILAKVYFMWWPRFRTF